MSSKSINNDLRICFIINSNCFFQLHNAHQLADWCLAYLSQNYNHICRKFPKILRSLYPENQATLNLYRWPPVWYEFFSLEIQNQQLQSGGVNQVLQCCHFFRYLKEYDNYQKLLSEREREERPKNLKRARSNSGI